MALAGSWSDVGGAHIQAFTFSSQDHGRLSAVLWCVCGVCAANFEAFECDLAHGRCTAVSSLPPSLPSLLPSLPLLLQKKKRGLFITGIFPARNLFFITVCKLIPKNRRRVKLQALQFYINSKTRRDGTPTSHLSSRHLRR